MRGDPTIFGVSVRSSIELKARKRAADATIITKLLFIVPSSIGILYNSVAQLSLMAFIVDFVIV